MRDILTITLNPALDVSASVPHVTAGAKLRCGPERYDPGGGGLNAARAIHFLGGEVRAFAALGGARGAHLARLLEAEGIAYLSDMGPRRNPRKPRDHGRGDGLSIPVQPSWPAMEHL